MQKAAETPSAWGTFARRFLLTAGTLAVLYALTMGCRYALGYWQWQTDGEAITSPSGRYAASRAVIVYPGLDFGLVLADEETGRTNVVAGWTGDSQWSHEIVWTAEDELRVEYHEQNSLRWGRRTEALGVKIDWVLVPRPVLHD